MTVFGGDIIYAADINGLNRIATATYDTDSATFTTALTEIASVTAALVSGRTYHIRIITHIGSSAGSDTANLQLREDDTSGTELQGSVSIPVPTTTAPGFYAQVEADYTAVATGNKTFIAAAQRASGAGNLRREAAGTRPTLLTVDYAYG